MPRKKIDVTYSITTPESAAEGDHADHGFIDVPTGEHLSLPEAYERWGAEAVKKLGAKARGETVKSVEEAAEFILSSAGWGTIEPSSSGYGRHVWYSSIRSEGYDGSEEWSFHPKGFSLSEGRRLYELITGRRS